MLTSRGEISSVAQRGQTHLPGGSEEEEEDTSSWKRFCREQGRMAAEQFTNRMRAFKDSHTAVCQPDSALAREFSASLCEHLAAMTSTVAEAHGTSGPSLVSINSAITGNSVQDASSSSSRQGHKHWWQFFKRGKSLRLGGSGRRRNQSVPAVSDRQVMLEQVVSQLNLNDGWERGKMSWSRCRLVLVRTQGNHQLEIYTPHKVRERNRQIRSKQARMHR